MTDCNYGPLDRPRSPGAGAVAPPADGDEDQAVGQPGEHEAAQAEAEGEGGQPGQGDQEVVAGQGRDQHGAGVAGGPQDPPRLRAKTSGTSATGGVIAQLAGIRVAYLVMAAGVAASTALGWSSPALRRRLGPA